MPVLRVIFDLEGRDAYWNMAIDEALLELRSREEAPDTLRIYVFNPSAVTIGYFQKISESVDLEFLHSKGIDVTRRITGGGAVFHDYQGELTYSIVTPAQGPLSDVNESYRIICSGIVHALRSFGVQAEFVPINDVSVHGKKISGSAQTRRGEVLLQHGTLMYNTDLDTLEKALRVPAVKLASKGVSSIRERVTTLYSLIPQRPSKREIAEALVAGFSQALGRRVFFADYSEAELELARKLVEKYKSRDWIFRR